jgi:hypothetical protein
MKLIVYLKYNPQDTSEASDATRQTLQFLDNSINTINESGHVLSIQLIDENDSAQIAQLEEYGARGFPFMHTARSVSNGLDEIKNSIAHLCLPPEETDEVEDFMRTHIEDSDESEAEDNMQERMKAFQRQRVNKVKKRPKTKKRKNPKQHEPPERPQPKRVSNVVDDPVDILRNMKSKSSEASQDNDLVAKFWAGRTETPGV